MALARIVFMSKKLREKFGPVGVVAARYLEAGYDVRVGFDTPKGRLSVVARREGIVLGIDVITESRRVEASDVEQVYEKARSINAKPILVLYGSGPKVAEEAKKKAEELGVELRRVRPK